MVTGELGVRQADTHSTLNINTHTVLSANMTVISKHTHQSPYGVLSIWSLFLTKRSHAHKAFTSTAGLMKLGGIPLHD